MRLSNQQCISAYGTARCYTAFMPTTRPRHTITETPPVKEALDGLRSKLGEGERIDYAELVTLGARAKARRLLDDEQAAAAAGARLAEMVRTGSFPFKVDIEAAEEVKRLGLIADDDDR
jgi:hypothetical protein